MFGFLIGTACLIGLVKVLRGGCGYGYGSRGRWGGGSCGGGSYGGNGGPWQGRGRWGGHDERGHHGGWGHDERGHHGGWGGRGGFFLRMLLEQLDASPAQEKVIVAAYNEVREDAQKQREELKKTRADIAKAMRGANFDEVLFGELFARHDTVIEHMRKSAMGAMGKVHEALDEKQRARFADMIEQGPGYFRPFRSRGYDV